jgi:response regulator RpfG family c-di-GMP phosphodiesterase/serine/threonine protein kinase
MLTLPTLVVPSELEKFVRQKPSYPASTRLVEDLLESSVLLVEDWQALPRELQDELTGCDDTDTILTVLVEHRLLTKYQAERILAGTTYGLVLGNYRVLDRLGAGGMAVVFKAEHIDMRRVVAIKVLPVSRDRHSKLLPRFITEMRTIAQLQHPNIVAAFDAGKTLSDDPDAAVLRYIVMEYVPGLTLEDRVDQHGRLDPAEACDIIHQIAAALAEADKLNLVHRDIKPSNILVTPEGQAKLLDFGLVHQLGRNLTEAGTILGTMDYMAPEQTQDASRVDIRADLYGLGGTLFWALTGQTPFIANGTWSENLTRRFVQPPPSVRALRPEIPAGLDAVVARLLAVKPEDRYAKPRDLMRALLPFLKPDARDDLDPMPAPGQPDKLASATDGVKTVAKAQRVLIVDDEPSIRQFCRIIMNADGIACDEAADGFAALDAVKLKTYDLVLIDNCMPRMKGMELLRQLRENPPSPHLKTVMISGQASSDEMARMLMAGADDYLTKPFSMIQLKSRIHTALRLKEAQDHSDLLNRHLLKVNAEIERTLSARDSDLVHARNALVLALAKLVEQRDTETSAHLVRLQRFSRCLAEQAAGLPVFKNQIDRHFIEMLECCVPLHDIGKVGLPDHILGKPGKLAPDERILMQAHTTIGSDTLAEVAKQHGSALAFLQMAIDIARHHHERFDGVGYPDHLVGDEIPLAARIVAIADVYDALRCRRVWRPALSHIAALQVMTEASAGQFDPNLLHAFSQCSDHFARIFRDVPG